MMPSTPQKRSSPGPDATEPDEPQTPFGQPPTKKIKITQRQKQALMDNLQLEITERARKLRAHYALQIQDLRSRLERRVNRIPVVLRKQTMGDLLAKHAEPPKEEAGEAPKPRGRVGRPPTRKATGTKGKTAPNAQAKAKLEASKQPAKRKSDEFHSSDKENAPATEDVNPPLENPKKRAKPNAAPGASRAVSQLAAAEFAESRVLSPKSSNSRTFPHSPLKSPSKANHQQYMSRRSSPLKATSPSKQSTEAPKARATRGAAASQKTTSQENVAPSMRAKHGPTKSITSATTGVPGSIRRAPPSRPATRERNRRLSTSTVASNASNSTTIVRSTRTNAAANKSTTSISTTSSGTSKKSGLPRGLASTASSAAKKVTGTIGRKGQTVEPPAPGRRVLRNRG